METHHGYTVAENMGQAEPLGTLIPVLYSRKGGTMDNGQEPATKADLNVLRDELNALREEFLEAIHDTETRLLRAFYDFAETNQKRLAEVERSGVVFIERLAMMERRITEVEKRLNMPPTS